MALPTIKIISQSRREKNMTIDGVVSGSPSSATIALLAVGDGATAVAARALPLGHEGKFSIVMPISTFGSYTPQVSATNADGTATGDGVAMRLYANTTQTAIGLPVVQFPAVPPVTFLAPTVALGGVVTDVTLKSTAPSAQTNVPFTFGQPFKQGELASGDFLLGRIAGEADLPLQFNVKATHPDGSVRHAIVSGVLPALAAGASKVISLVRANSTSVSTAPIASSAFTAGGFSAVANLTVGGAAHTASTAAALAAGIDPATAWLGGGVATEYSLMLPVVADVGGAANPHLTVQFNIRFYPGANAAKVDITIEHTKATTAVADVPYTGAFRIAGVERQTFNVNHFPAARWKKTLWWNNDYPVHVRHNAAYFIATRQVANYDQSVVITEATLAGYATLLADAATFAPMGAGPFNPAMGTTGGRPDIGLLPAWMAAAVLSTDKRAIDLTLASGDVGGSWATHRRDTSTGPGAGLPLSVLHFPSTTILGNPSDSKNWATGQEEKLPSITRPNPNAPENPYTTVSNMYEDDSHQPNFAYLPYLITGDLFYLEELQFWATWLAYYSNPGYRNWSDGLLIDSQVRGQAWGLRTMGDAAAITPDAHPLKSHFTHWVYKTLRSHNTRWTDNPNANTLGINDCGGYTVVYPYAGPNGIAPWQDDHFTSAVGHLAELGFTEASRLLRWKAKFQIGRLLAPGYCYIHAAIYQLRVRETPEGPLYTTLAECLDRSAAANTEFLTSTVHALPCNSQARLDQMNAERGLPSNPYVLNEIIGYAYSTAGFPSNYQPALAMAVDSGYTDGDLAWDLFNNRAVKPDYGTAAQFAIIPREESASAMTAPADNYQVTSGQPMYFGKAAPTTTFTTAGDVIVDGDSNTDVSWNNAAFRLGSPLTKFPPRIVFNAGVAGQTTQQLADKLPGDIAKFPAVKVWVIRVGTNGWNAPLADHQAQFNRIFSTLESNLIVAVIHAIPPRSEGTLGMNSGLIAVNAWLKAQCEAKPDRRFFVDDSIDLGDANYNALAPYYSEPEATGRIHPNGKGLVAQAQRMAPRYLEIFPHIDSRITNANDTYEKNPASNQFVPNPMMGSPASATFNGSSITGVVPAGYTLSNGNGTTTCVTSVVAADAGDAVQAPWLRLGSISAGGSGQYLLVQTPLVHPAIAADDTVKRFDIVAEMRFNALNTSVISAMTMSLFNNDGTAGFPHVLNLTGNPGVLTMAMVLRSSNLLTQEQRGATTRALRAYPANSLALRVYFDFSGALASIGSVDIRCVSVRAVNT